MVIRLSLTLSLSLALVSCYAPIKVREITPPVPAAQFVSEDALEQAAKPSRKDPFGSTALVLDGLRLAYDRLLVGDRSALPEYNYLTARLVEQIRGIGIKPWQDLVEIPGRKTKYILRGSQPSDLNVAERYFVAADSVEFEGRYSKEKAVKEGVGAPLLAILSSPPSEHESFDKNFRYRNVTALVTFKGEAATIDLRDPYVSETVSIGSRSYPLHADFGFNASYALSKTRLDKLGLARLLDPERYNNTAGLSRLQPYDPNRIPVLFVHGLQDTPASFAPMYVSLMSDPDIRKKYQFWVFSYPSGYPFPYSASLLRKELDRMQLAFPDHKDVVMIGHSMGGLLTRLMLTNANDKLWRGLFKSEAPNPETEATRLSHDVLYNSIVFNSRTDIDRAIFIAAPHRGSNLASNWIGRIGSKLVKLPASLADARDSLFNVFTVDTAGLALDRVPNSIDTLSPKNKFVIEMNKIPLDQRIPHHSIMGDRGKGDTPDSSDGVVAYWSSHVETAKSEKIVPSDHSAHQNEEGIEEVHRILRSHAGLR